MQKLIWLVHGLSVERILVGHRAADTSDDAFDRVIAHCGRGEWSRASEELTALADAGTGEAARLALLMTDHGPRLFGQRLNASPQQRRRWQESARLVDTARSSKKSSRAVTAARVDTFTSL